jgi:hypothetical protein
MLGRDKLVFPDRFGLQPPRQQSHISIQWKTLRHVPAGRPFRPGVEVEVSDARPGGATHSYVRLNDVYDILVEWDAGYFVDKIETEPDFKAFLFRLYNVPSGDWISPDELRRLLKVIEAAPRELRFKVVSKEFEGDLLTKGVFRHGDVWLAALVVQEGASIVEFKVAIDGKNRVAYHRRVIVQGPQPPLTGPGLFTWEQVPGDNAAYALAFPFLCKAIKEAKKGNKRWKE